MRVLKVLFEVLRSVLLLVLETIALLHAVACSIASAILGLVRPTFAFLVTTTVNGRYASIRSREHQHQQQHPSVPSPSDATKAVGGTLGPPPNVVWHDGVGVASPGDDDDEPWGH